MAALAYASQLLIPLLVPIVILVSETSKKRPFQRYHAIHAIAVALVIWGVELALMVMASVATATIILALCLCFIVPAMIVLWLLPLYYALLAYNGKRIRIPGITQFLQLWLIQVIALSDHAYGYPALVGGNQRIAQAPQIEVIHCQVDGCLSLPNGRGKNLIDSAAVGGGGWIVRVSEINRDSFGWSRGGGF